MFFLAICLLSFGFIVFPFHMELLIEYTTYFFINSLIYEIIMVTFLNFLIFVGLHLFSFRPTLKQANAPFCFFFLLRWIVLHPDTHLIVILRQT